MIFRAKLKACGKQGVVVTLPASASRDSTLDGETYMGTCHSLEL